MVEYSEHDTEGALAELFDNFVSEADVLIITDDVFLLVRVETVICLFIGASVVEAARQVRIVFILLSICYVEKVHYVELGDLLLLTLPEQVFEHDLGLSTLHGELDLALASTRPVRLICLQL